jgi:fructose-1-phosphate kinase PfkB-like protein
MILVFAPHPVLERVALVEQFVAGEPQKPMRVTTYAGGAGLRAANVARLLKADVLALGFAGGHLGALLRDGLDRQDIPHVLTPIADPGGTRGDFLLLDREKGVVTEVPEGAPDVTEAETEKLLAMLERHVGGASLLIVADGQRDADPPCFSAPSRLPKGPATCPSSRTCAGPHSKRPSRRASGFCGQT